MSTNVGLEREVEAYSWELDPGPSDIQTHGVSFQKIFGYDSQLDFIFLSPKFTSSLILAYTK